MFKLANICSLDGTIWAEFRNEDRKIEFSIIPNGVIFADQLYTEDMIKERAVRWTKIVWNTSPLEVTAG